MYLAEWLGMEYGKEIHEELQEALSELSTG